MSNSMEKQETVRKFMSSYQTWIMRWKEIISRGAAIEDYKKRDERKGWIPMQAVVR